MALEVSKMTKEEIKARERFKCPEKGHGSKDGFQHPVCFDKHAKGMYQEKILFFDIEAEDLNADFGIVFNWYAIDEDGNEFEDYITLEDIKKFKSASRDIMPKEDTRVIKSLVELMSKYTRVVGHYSCLTPGHRILTADLKWEKVENLKKGDKLLAFEETPKGTSFRKFIPSEVLRNEPSKEEVYEIKLSDGTILQTTEEHPWLIKSTHSHRWATTKELYKTLSSKMHNGGINFNRILPTWETNNTHEAGWLSGFFDGEGDISQCIKSTKGYGKYNFQVKASQNPGEVLEKAKKILTSLNYKYTITQDKRGKCNRIFLKGGLPTNLKFLGQIRPIRLLKNFKLEKLGALKTNMPIGLKIISIKPIGKKTVMVLSTSSKTYISEGFASHNCRYDLPFIRTRAVICKVEFPSFGMLFQSDTWILLKKKFKLSRNSLQNGCLKLLGISRKDHLSLAIKHGCLRGETWAINDSRVHCKKDVLDLIDLFNITSKYMKRTKSSI